jgi:CxxC motif-containing protein (DUF1111 family)
MRTTFRARRTIGSFIRLGGIWVVGLAAISASADEPKANPPVNARAALQLGLGRELFVRQWVPGDRRSHGGDGLGPVYNERSCVGCHHQAGPGGGGSADKNIEIVTPTTGELAGQPGYFYAFSFSYGADGFQYQFGSPTDAQNRARQPGGAVPAELVRIHPGFRDAPGVLLHRYGNDGDYRVWREWVLGRHGTIALRTSERNPPPLFGAGLIERIADAAIEAAARRKHSSWPQVKGRVNRLDDGRIGRFGWKAQTANVRDFSLTAAAVEMGLEVPGHTQAADPRVPPLAAPGLDMNAAECDALVAFVASLPAPAPQAPENPRDERAIKAGRNLFKSIGCAECHSPQLGGVENLYSDLLLHDLGRELSDTPAYRAFGATPAEQPVGRAVGERPRRASAASPDEWRTPPLWGLSDSAPYLHDGRALSIEEAILLHGGEALPSSQRYRQLPATEQAQLHRFLSSLAVPRPPAVPRG